MINVWKTVMTQRYAQFEGRAGQGEYWWFVLANVLAAVVLMVLANISIIFLLLYVGWLLAALIPSIAVLVRRLHDTNRSGGWFFINFVPIVGPIILLVFLASGGDAGPNQYGEPPASIS